MLGNAWFEPVKCHPSWKWSICASLDAHTITGNRDFLVISFIQDHSHMNILCVVFYSTFKVGGVPKYACVCKKLTHLFHWQLSTLLYLSSARPPPTGPARPHPSMDSISYWCFFCYSILSFSFIHFTPGKLDLVHFPYFLLASNG